MTPEHWHRVEELFGAASALPDDERAAFLDEACAGDKALRDEVNSLLDESEAQDSFLSRANVTVGLHLLSENEGAAFVGQQVGKYVVRALLGRGGMGQVYLAEDSQLGRRVALKLLPSYLTGDPDTVQRFQQEARAASGVSHPNVAHVYEIGSAGDRRHYIAMEYLEGSTLRELLRHESISVGEATEIALQVANALAAAHAAGIVHRDIKPENIMVVGDGHAKVLDFGLAKLTEARGDAHRPGPSSGSSVDTTPGMIMGTAAYMSPEQVRGQAVDARSDVWSLGIVLYEMLARRQPFAGETPSDVAAAILLKEPTPLLADKSLPDELVRIVHKALSKEKDSRHQTAEELARDLKRVKQQIDFSEHFLSGGAASFENGHAANSGSATPALVQSNTTATQRGFFPRTARSKKLLAVGLSLITLAALAGSLLFAYRRSAGSTGEARTTAAHTVARITNSGSAVRSAISADGNFIAYVLEEAGHQGLYLRRVSSGTEDVPVVPPTANEFVGVSFSPDNHYLYFGFKHADEVIASLYRIALADGGVSPQKILTDIDSAAAFSPDGRQFVFLRIGGDGSHEDIRLADADGADERLIYTRSMPEYIPHQAQPVFSPDGNVIAFAAGDYVNGEKRVRLLGLRLSDSSIVQLAAGDWTEISQAAWAGSTAIIMTARAGESQDVKQLWRIAQPSGTAEQLTNDFNDYTGVSVAADGVTLVTQAGTRKVSLWEASVGAQREAARQLTFGNDDGYGVSAAQGGRIVFGSNATGDPDIWSMNGDGSERRRLTTDAAADADPSVSPDGRLIVFTSTRTGTRHIWIMDADGARQRQLTQGTGESTPTFSADGRSVFYFSFTAGSGSLWNVPAEGGDATLTLTGNPRFPAASPDGKWLATAYRPEGTTVNKIGVIPTEALTSEPSVFDPVTGARSPGQVRWERDGKAFNYIVTRRGVSNIWQQPLDKSPARQITNFADSRIYAFDWSPDGSVIVCARGDAQSSVLLFRLK